MGQPHILVIDDNELSARMVAELLSRRNYTVSVKTDPLEALKWLRIPGNVPDLIVSDLMMPGLSGHELVRQVRSDPTLAHLPIILLTAKSQLEDKVAGYEAGADDYLVKPVNPVELELRIKALLARIQSRLPVRATLDATVVVVFSLRGGAGTTSLAVNLGVALASMWNIQVPLIDLALKNGHCALMLNLKPRVTMSAMVDWKEPATDPDMVENLLVVHPSGVKLLPAPVSPVDAELITPTVLDRAWPHLRAHYRFLVVDAGSHLTEVALTALERARAIVLVLTPELAGLKAGVDAQNIFDRLGFDRARIIPVVNWVFAGDGLPQKGMESALGSKIDHVIPYERNAFVKAINSGQPLIGSDPKSKASIAMARLAYKLSAEEMKGVEIARPSPLLTLARQLA